MKSCGHRVLRDVAGPPAPPSNDNSALGEQLKKGMLWYNWVKDLLHMWDLSRVASPRVNGSVGQADLKLYYKSWLPDGLYQQPTALGRPLRAA